MSDRFKIDQKTIKSWGRLHAKQPKWLIQIQNRFNGQIGVTNVTAQNAHEKAAWTVSCFEWGIEDRCEAMMGEKFGHCKGFNDANKTSKLTLANPYQYKTGNYLKMWDLRGDPMNPVNLFIFMMDKHLSPAMQFHGLTDAPLFNSRAVGKELKVSCVI